MPGEPISLLLRPRHFFDKNPALDVPPSLSVMPSEVRAGKLGEMDREKVDGTSGEVGKAECCAK